MNLCERVADRMPAVASGAAAWSEDDRQHVASCGSCMAEWRLLQSVERLGARLPTPDPGVLATTVLARVRDAEVQDRRTRRTHRVGGLVVLAAAAALAATVLVQGPRGPEPVVSPVGFALPLAELEGASDAELRAVLADFEPPMSDGQSVGIGLDGMDANEVERALSAWEES